MTDSCFVKKLSHFLELGESEKKALATLEENPVTYDAGDVVIEENDNVSTLYTVKTGWLHASNSLADGNRQILRLYYPGDLMGMASIAFASAAATIVAVTPTELCRFPKKALRDIFIEHPRIAALFYSLGMLENVVLSDRLKCLGRCTGKGKLSGFLLEILYRLRITNGDVINSFELPLTQSDIGDAVGLTNIHVSRVLKMLESSGAIKRKGSHFTLTDFDYLAEEAHFSDRFTSIDTSWYPPRA